MSGADPGAVVSGGSPVRTAPVTARVFFALELPEPVRERLGDELGALRGRLPKAKWVRPSGLHVTIKFLGEVEPRRLQPLVDELRESLALVPPIEVELGGAGFFPDPRRPRVAWVGGAAPGVELIVAEVEQAAVRHGFAAETKPWSLHVTVARLKKPWPRGAVDELLAWGERVHAEPFACDEVVLFESQLHPDGARYVALERLPLRGAVQ